MSAFYNTIIDKLIPKAVEFDEKSGQLIECVNPAHLYFGSIHYIQPDCVGKWQIADSDESWQASEALLKRGEHL